MTAVARTMLDYCADTFMETRSGVSRLKMRMSGEQPQYHDNVLWEDGSQGQRESFNDEVSESKGVYQGDNYWMGENVLGMTSAQGGKSWE